MDGDVAGGSLWQGGRCGRCGGHQHKTIKLYIYIYNNYFVFTLMYLFCIRMPLSKLVVFTHVIHFYLLFCTVPTMPPPMPFSKAVVFTNLYLI